MPSKTKIAALLAAPLLIVSFQNCSDFSLSDQIMYEQALMESRDALDAEQLPSLLESSTLTRWYKTSDNNYVSKTPSGDQMSVIIALPRTSTGKVLYINSATDTEEGSITITGGKIQAARYNNVGTAYSETVEGSVPSSGDNMVISASFGAKVGEVSLLVNGKVVQSSVVTTGTPADFTTGARNIYAAGTPLEFVVYMGDSATNAANGKLSTAQQNVMSRYIANNNSIPNVIFDPVVVGGVSGGDGDGGDGGVDNSRFLAAKTILDNNCLVCHNGTQSPDLRSYTEAKALANGDVVKGSPSTSKLYFRLTSATSGAGPRTMPQGGSISASDAQAIADWITNIP